MPSSRTSRTHRARVAAAGAGLVALWVAGAPAAVAGLGGGGTETNGGYGAGAVSVTVTGDVDPGLRASVPAPPPLCWWEPVSWPVDPSDPEALKQYYLDELRSSSSTMAYFYYSLPDGDATFEQAIKAAKKGEKLTFYSLQVNRSGLDGDIGQQNQALAAAGCGEARSINQEYGGTVLISYRFFAPGEVPEPVVDPEILAEYAYEVMNLPEPTLDWNPKIGNVANASLVNIPTWLWVEDEGAVGERSVTATAGAVSVTVTATTGGLSVTSPAGTITCSPEQARTSYSAGASEDSACTLGFNRASWGYPQGFPVDASTDWEASWTSNTGEGDDLQGRTQAATTFIPVAESQALVSQVR